MGALLVEDRKYTYEEYEAILKSSEQKIEYLDGKLRLMAGGTINHNRAKDSLVTYILRQDQSCRYFSSDTAVYIGQSNKYYFPECSFVCTDTVAYTDNSIEQITNPTLIIEVLSDGTDGVDRGEKFHAYFSLPSFREYVLVDSQRVRVDVFYREAASTWSMRSYYAPEQRVHLQSLKLDVPVSAIYADTDLL